MKSPVCCFNAFAVITPTARTSGTQPRRRSGRRSTAHRTGDPWACASCSWRRGMTARLSCDSASQDRALSAPCWPASGSGFEPAGSGASPARRPAAASDRQRARSWLTRCNRTVTACADTSTFTPALPSVCVCHPGPGRCRATVSTRPARPATPFRWRRWFQATRRRDCHTLSRAGVTCSRSTIRTSSESGSGFTNREMVTASAASILSRLSRA